LPVACHGGYPVLQPAFLDRFAAVASFHGGNLGTDIPDSSRLFVKNITARIYVAGAIEDASFPDEQKIRLELLKRNFAVWQRNAP
jgi:carboxymethylenebutenolidase